MKKSKKGMEWDQVLLLVLAVAGLVLVVIGIYLLSGNLDALLESIRNFFSFGR